MRRSRPRYPPPTEGRGGRQPSARGVTSQRTFGLVAHHCAEHMLKLRNVSSESPASRSQLANTKEETARSGFCYALLAVRPAVGCHPTYGWSGLSWSTNGSASSAVRSDRSLKIVIVSRPRLSSLGPYAKDSVGQGTAPRARPLSESGASEVGVGGDSAIAGVGVSACGVGSGE